MIIHRHWDLQVETPHGCPRLPVSLHWDPVASLEVGLSIRRLDGTLMADWVLARQLLADALTFDSAGVGHDVYIRRHGLDPDLMEIVLSVHGHRAAVQVGRLDLAGFVNQTRGYVGLDEAVAFKCEHCPLSDPAVFPVVVPVVCADGDTRMLPRALCPDCLAAHTLEGTP